MIRILNCMFVIFKLDNKFKKWFLRYILIYNDCSVKVMLYLMGVNILFVKICIKIIFFFVNFVRLECCLLFVFF